MHHYSALKKDAQDITDTYISTFKAVASKTQTEYKKLLVKADALRTRLSQYPREWNTRIWAELQRIENRCQPFTDIATNFDRYTVKSLRSRLDLRDVTTALEAAPTIDNSLFSLDAQIQIADPNPKPQPPVPDPDPAKPQPPTPPTPPQPYQPKTHRLKSRIPQGAISVAQYRDWLTQQLALLNSFNEKDSVNLNE